MRIATSHTDMDAYGRTEDALTSFHGLRDHPADPDCICASSLLESLGCSAPAAAEPTDSSPDHLSLLVQAAHLCTEAGAADKALSLSMRAMQRAPADPRAQTILCESLLCAGRPAEAEAKAAALCSALPGNQYALALRATAWRLTWRRAVFRAV